MTRLLRRLVSLVRGTPSEQALAAERRLAAVRGDDAKIADMIQRQREIIRENHLGPMIADLFERRPRT